MGEASAPASLAIAGLDRPSKAALAIAGNLTSTLRKTLGSDLLNPDKAMGLRKVGDRIAARTWERTLWFPDWTYLACQDGKGGLRWRNDRDLMFSAEARQRYAEMIGAPVRLFLDSSAFRRWTGQATPWTTYENYLKAIDLIQPDAFMAWDTFGDAAESLKGYARMLDDGYGDDCIPVWPMNASWDSNATTPLNSADYPESSEAARVAVANARRAVKDPVFQYMASRSNLVAIGGMVKGPCPREVRHIYLAELCRLMPDHQFWAMGQASNVVLNGLNRLGLLDRVWLDGSWWILNAMTERLAVLENGMITNINLRTKGITTFFTVAELMTSNLRSAIGAYLQEWAAPGPPTVPTDVRDPEVRMELRRRIKKETLQLNLFTPLEGHEDADHTGTEG